MVSHISCGSQAKQKSASIAGFYRSSPRANNPDPVRAEAQRLAFAAEAHTALAGSFIRGDDLARHIGVVVSAYDFPAALVFGAMPRFKFHCAIPIKVHARFASVASGVAGATTVSTTPAVKTVAELIVNVAVAADAVKTIIPTFVLFL